VGVVGADEIVDLALLRYEDYLCAYALLLTSRYLIDGSLVHLIYRLSHLGVSFKGSVRRY
jgi:hypothetical protein